MFGVVVGGSYSIGDFGCSCFASSAVTHWCLIEETGRQPWSVQQGKVQEYRLDSGCQCFASSVVANWLRVSVKARLVLMGFETHFIDADVTSRLGRLSWDSNLLSLGLELMARPSLAQTRRLWPAQSEPA